MKNDGGPAFPAPRFEWEEGGYGQPSRWVPMWDKAEGMSIRDYFAAQILGHLLAMPMYRAWTDIEITGAAYRYANAMLKARQE